MEIFCSYGIFVNLDKEKREGKQRIKIGQVLEGFELIPAEPKPLDNEEKNEECVINSDTENDIVGYDSEESECNIWD